MSRWTRGALGLLARGVPWTHKGSKATTRQRGDRFAEKDMHRRQPGRCSRGDRASGLEFGRVRRPGLGWHRRLGWTLPPQRQSEPQQGPHQEHQPQRDRYPSPQQQHQRQRSRVRLEGRYRDNRSHWTCRRQGRYRGNRSDRPEGGDRGNRGNRGNRSGRSDRGNRGNRGNRSDRSDRSDRSRGSLRLGAAVSYGNMRWGHRLRRLSNLLPREKSTQRWLESRWVLRAFLRHRKHCVPGSTKRMACATSRRWRFAPHIHCVRNLRHGLIPVANSREANVTWLGTGGP
jgi:hypothetical protein